MIEEIYLKDKSSQNKIEEIVTSFYFPWFYNSFTSFNDKGEKHQYIHGIVKPESGDEICSPWGKEILSFFSNLPEFKTHRLFRAKINLNNPYKKRNAIYPHQDDVNPLAISYLYYCIDSDGHSKFFLNRWRTKKVLPEKGKLVRFPSNMLHSGNIPFKYERRIVLNLVFLPN